MKRVIQVAQGTVPKPDRTAPDLDSNHHAGQRATLFVLPTLSAFVALLSLLVLATLLISSWMRGIGEEVSHHALAPANRLNKEVTALAIEDAPVEGGSRLLAADRDVLHVGRRVRDLHYWQRKPIEDLGIEASSIAGMDADTGRLYLMQEEEGKRGLAASSLPEDLGEMEPWKEPILDTSYFKGLDETARSVLFQPSNGRRFVAGDGVGPYDVAKRSWDDAITNENDGSGSLRVNDMAPMPHSAMALLGDNGITVGKWTDAWNRAAHYGREDGLVGDDIAQARFYPAETSEWLTDAGGELASAQGDLVYMTSGRGFGRLEFDESGALTRAHPLIGEGSAPGLTRDGIVRADSNRERDKVWMVFDDPDENAGSSDGERFRKVALYQVGAHEMDGTDEGRAWSDAFTLAVDDHAEGSPTAWIGDEGLYRVSLFANGLGVDDAGLAGERVGEVLPTPKLVFARTRDASDSTATQALRVSQRTDLESGRGGWQPYIGPRRFEGLAQADITAVSDGQFDDHEAIYIGSRNREIAVFDRKTREIFRAFKPDDAGLPANDTLDLEARGNQLVQVTQRRSVNFFDGREWSELIAANGIAIPPGQVRTMVSRGPDLVIGSTNRIGHYDARTHEWVDMPAIPNLDRLLIALGQLWALDTNGELFTYPLGVSGDGWAAQDSGVVDLYGDDEMVIWISEIDGTGRLWVERGGEDGRELVVETNTLQGTQTQWRTAAVVGDELYLAPHGNAIGRYELGSHRWEAIPLPPATPGSSVVELVATRSGLWLLVSNRNLFWRPFNADNWTQAAQGVTRISADESLVVALTNDGKVLASESGALPMRTMVGAAASEPLANLRAAAVFDADLFIATSSGVDQYGVAQHSWTRHTLVSGQRVEEFAYHESALFARVGNGRVFRYLSARSGDGPGSFTPVTLGGQPLVADQIAGRGGEFVAVRQTSGAVLALHRDDDEPKLLLAATRAQTSGALTAAAEAGRELLVATGSGVSGFAKAEGQPWKWSRALAGGNTGPVRQLLVPPGRSDVAIAIANQNVVLSRNPQQGIWQISHTLAGGHPRAVAAVGKRDLYTLNAAAAGGPRIAKVLFDASTGGAAAQLSTLVGARFNGSAATRAIGSTARGDVYRVDAQGNVGHYDARTHTWQAEPDLQAPARFLSVNEQLWAWSNNGGRLSRLQDSSWVADPNSWQQVVGDGRSALGLAADGALKLWRDGRESELIPALQVQLPVQSVEQIRVLAQQGNVLYLAARNGDVVSYDRSSHRWATQNGLTGVEEFAALGDGSGSLFARTSAGTLHRVQASAPSTRVSDPQDPQATIDSIDVAGDHLVAITSNGNVLFIDQSGRVASSHRPRMLAGRTATALRFVAAAEVEDHLLLVSRSDQTDELLVYDPSRHAWSVHALNGTAKAFMRSGNTAWLGLEQGGSVQLVQLTGSPPAPGRVIGPFRDAESEGTNLFVVTQRGEVHRVDDSGSTTAVGVAQSALPENAVVVRAFGVGNECAVLLQDGSAHHYTPSREWQQRIEPLATPSLGPGSFVRFGGDTLLLFRPDGQIYQANPGTGQWTLLNSVADITLAAPTAGTPNAVCSVVNQGDEQVFSQPVDGGVVQLTLQDGKFDWDRVDALAIRGDVLSVQTNAGPRQFAAGNSGTWNEIAQAQPFPTGNPDALTFEGGTFKATRDVNGAFRTDGERVSIAQRLGSGTISLSLAQGVSGAGFAHDVIRDVAVSNGNIWLATAAGAVALDAGSGRVSATALQRLAGDASFDLDSIVADASGLVARKRDGTFWQRPANGSNWSALAVGAANQRIAAASSIDRYNRMLRDWRISADGNTTGLEVKSVGETFVGVSLTRDGFGFDRPRALAVGADEVRLYTADGLVRLSHERAMTPTSIDAAFALPSGVDTVAELLEVRSGNSIRQAWLRTRNGAQRFSNGSWRASDAAGYAQALAQRVPKLWDAHGVRWDRSDDVEFDLAGGSTAQFRYEAQSGRFDVDEPIALVVYRDEPWVVTQGGVVRYGSDGSWQALTLTNEIFDASAEFVVVSDGGDSHLILRSSGQTRQWNGSQWRQPTNPVGVQRHLNELQTYLVHGENWQIARSDAAAAPFAMRARLVRDGDLVDVELDGTGRFDFERVNAVMVHGGNAHVASQFGLSAVNPDSLELSAAIPQPQPVARLGVLEGELMARLSTGQDLLWNENAWGPATRSFVEIDERLAAGGEWTVTRRAGQVDIELRGGLWDCPIAVSVDVSGTRFSFDTVRDVASAGKPWLATDAGLLERSGHRIANCATFQLANVPSGTRLLERAVPVTESVLYARTMQGLYFLNGGTWEPDPNPAATQQLLAEQVARNTGYLVERAGNDLSVAIHRETDHPGLYKPAPFSVNRFGFDAFRAVSRHADPAHEVALVGTEAGVVGFPLGSSGKERIYRDPTTDGIGPVRVDELVAAPEAKRNFLLDRGGALYRLTTDAPDRWAPGDGADQQTLASVRRAIANDPDGWMIQRDGGGFDTRWRRSPVHLIDASATGDASSPITRFAHDVALSASLSNKGMWVGTRGGAVFFPDPQNGQNFDLYAQETLTAAELAFGAIPRGIGFIRANEEGDSVFATRESDAAVLRRAGESWQTSSANDAGFIAARTVASDSLWKWTKDSTAAVRVVPNPQILRVPEDYDFVANGTWAFLETNHVMPTDPKRSIAYYRDSLFVSTPSGVTRFPLPAAQGEYDDVWPGDAKDFVGTVYGVARSGNSNVPMPGIVELYVDSNDRLFARSRSRSYAYDPARDEWRRHTASDPFSEAMLVADNDLFRWRALPNGGYDIVVRPLQADMENQAGYQLFTKGRFAFDQINAFIRTGDTIWLATDGGACLYDMEDFTPRRFVAHSYLSADTDAPSGLPLVREIVRDPAEPNRILTRSATEAMFQLHPHETRITAVTPEAGNQVFVDAYTREAASELNHHMRWVQYPIGSVPHPSGALEVHLVTASGRPLVLGTALDADRPLFSNERLSFDDVRGIGFEGGVLLAATPMGIVEHDVTWDEQRAPLSRIRGFAVAREADDASAPVALDRLERMLEQRNGALIAWGDLGVYEYVRDPAADADLRWRVHPKIKPGELGPTMRLDDTEESWLLSAYGGDDTPMRVLQEVKDAIVASGDVDERFTNDDVSYAVLDADFIYQPNPNGGLMRIEKSDIR